MVSLLRQAVWRSPAGTKANNTRPASSDQDEPAAAETPGLLPARPKPTLATLPPEIHLLIAEYLTYPDALSLKHTNRHFYHLVDTGVKLKVDWLMERRLLHLECPSDSRCDLGSDVRFCRGSVKLLMQRRREHIECESRPGLGCLIYGTRTCPHARKLKTRVKRWLRVFLGYDVVAGSSSVRWVLLLLVVPLLLSWVWLAALMFLRA